MREIGGGGKTSRKIKKDFAGYFKSLQLDNSAIPTNRPINTPQDTATKVIFKVTKAPSSNSKEVLVTKSKSIVEKYSIIEFM